MNPIRLTVMVSLVLAACSLAACGDDDNPQGPPPDEIATNLTDPAAVLASHAKALNKKDFVAYEALLDDQFEFYPLESDAEDFPWLQENSWPIGEELNIIAHLFDPNFAGQQNPIQGIEATLTAISQRSLDEGRIELVCTMRGRVLMDANNGWAFDTGLTFELVPRAGFLRIAKITETYAYRSNSLEGTSWGRIKATYR